MWKKDNRKTTWGNLKQDWDVLIIGGGITGAGVFRRSVAKGYKTLLVEAHDFSYGTSSRSSKLIHGGFRYLRNKQFDVTRESVREREWLLKEARNLVTPLGFIMPCPQDRKIASQFAIGVIIYDLLAPKWKHSRWSARKIIQTCPWLNTDNLKCGYLYYDAAMDDSRMVLRLLSEGQVDGGTALNYAKVTSLMRRRDGQVSGAVIKDMSTLDLGDVEIAARVVINATGPWSDLLRTYVDAPARLRKLRGSHLVFSRERFDLPYAITLLHPKDKRGMFAIPWEGVTLIGTTDLDHATSPEENEPFATQDEIDYILEAAAASFPQAQLTQADILSTYSGLRPVVNTGADNPSKESRAHVVWEESGLVTITGGKYTTFRLMAEQALNQAASHLPEPKPSIGKTRFFEPLPGISNSDQFTSSEMNYLGGRYGHELPGLIESAQPGESQPIENLHSHWAELRWAARCGAVEHLDDLLLRRVRIGMLLPDGARGLMPRIRAIVQSELGWDDQRWEKEETHYGDIYQRAYSPSPASK